MSFLLTLIAINFICFMPLYLANFRQQKNPIAFVTEKRLWDQSPFKWIYSKRGFSDPFHINFEYCLIIIALTLGGANPAWQIGIATAVFVLVTAEITYTAVFTYIFDRAPVFAGDIPLLKSGWILWKSNRHWLVLAVVLILAVLTGIGYILNSALVAMQAPQTWLQLGFIALLTPLCLFNWTSYNYNLFHHRTVYSTCLHVIRNIAFGRRFNMLFEKDERFFKERNLYQNVSLKQAPNVVHLCIESYGAIMFQDPEFRKAAEKLFAKYESKLAAAGFTASSSLSTAPIFTGGSWLSYASFMYGIRLDNLQLYDGLFQYSDGFKEYESIFHILNRNGYCNVLAAPLGGVDRRDVSWDTIARCFQPERILDWDAFGYQGQKLRFFNQKKTFCLPDQYAINRAYSLALETAQGRPVSMFYCTMNSHFPYESPVEIAQDWQQLNHPGQKIATTDMGLGIRQRYLDAIKYQLESVLDFVLNNPDNPLTVTLFGDHQPPLVATEQMGRETPVHVISNQPALTSSLQRHGFVPGLMLDPGATPIKHEGYLSLFINAMHGGFGSKTDAKLPIMASGVPLFEQVGIEK